MRDATWTHPLLSIALILAGLGALAAPAAAQLPDDPVAHWRLNELSGPAAADHAAGWIGSVQGASVVDGPSGNARRFDGVDDRIELPQGAVDALGALTEGSLSVWFRFDAFLGDTALMPFVYLGIDDVDEPDTQLVIEVGHRGVPGANRKLYITWVVDGVLPLCFDTGFDLDYDTWYHFVAVVGPQGNTGYLDGVELVDRHYNFGGPGDQLFLADITAQDVFWLGRGKSVDLQTQEFEDFHGDIDEFRVYDRPLSGAEVAALYAAERDAMLASDVGALVATDGGAVNLLLDAGPAHAGELRLMFCGLSGSQPGTLLPGPSQTVLPLNFDPFTELVFATQGTPLWDGFVGTLDAQGRGLATMNLPPLPPGISGTFTFAWAVKPWTLASNPVDVRLME